MPIVQSLSPSAYFSSPFSCTIRVGLHIFTLHISLFIDHLFIYSTTDLHYHHEYLPINTFSSLLR